MNTWKQWCEYETPHTHMRGRLWQRVTLYESMVGYRIRALYIK